MNPSPPYTQCPFCQTTFQVDALLLAETEGEIRCNSCQELFNAWQYSASVETPRAKTISEQTRERLSKQKNLPRASSYHYDNRPLSATLPDLQMEPPAKSLASSTASLILNLVGIILAASALLGQYLWFERAQLAWEAPLQPFYQKLCTLADCQVTITSRPDLLSTDSLEVTPNPKYQNLLNLSLSISNTAEFAQALPDIELRFTDLKARTIALRRFSAAEYQAPNAAKVVPANSATTFNWTVLKPGIRAVSYQIKLLPPQRKTL